MVQEGAGMGPWCGKGDKCGDWMGRDGVGNGEGIMVR